MLTRNKRRREFLIKYLVFTDLDGTLIDHDNYSYEKALPALEHLKKLKVPVIFCTSKTRAELEVYARELESDHPFISENGGAIFIPKDYFLDEPEHNGELENYFVVELGTAYEKLIKVINDIRRSTDLEILGFSDMDDQELSQDTGLDPGSAKLARMREYDEAFRLLNENEERADLLIEQIHSRGLNYTRGGRYWHLLGDNDKGKAVKLLADIYKEKNGPVKTVGLGDSLNDLPMLNAVDVPILVQKPGGIYDPKIMDERIKRADGIGPVGWNRAIFDIF